jgi:hypothetical protein
MLVFKRGGLFLNIIYAEPHLLNLVDRFAKLLGTVTKFSRRVAKLLETPIAAHAHVNSV